MLATERGLETYIWNKNEGGDQMFGFRDAKFEIKLPIRHRSKCSLDF